MIDGRPLSSSPSSEKAVLAALLVHNDLVSRACERLTLADFADAGCREVFRVVKILYGVGSPVDSQSIGEDIRARGGAGEALFDLIRDYPDCGDATFEGHIDNLRKLSALRGVTVDAERLIELATSPETSITAVSAAVDGMRDALAGAGRIATVSWPIEALSVERFLTTEPIPHDWLVDDLLVKGIVAMVFGPGGSYKTWIMILLCVYLTIADLFDDLHFLGEWRIEKPRRVLYLYPEDTGNDFHGRLKTIVDALCIKHPELATSIRRCVVERFLFLSRELFFEGDSGSLFDVDGQPMPKWDVLCRTVEEAKTDFLVIDTKSVCTDTAENVNEAQAQLTKHLGFLRDRTGITIVPIHHPSKVGSGSDSNGSTAFRGASSQESNARGLFQIMPYQLDDFGRPTSIRFTPIKVTHGPLPKKVTCLVASFPLFTKTDAPEIDFEEQEEQHCAVLVDHIRDHPGVSLKIMTKTGALKKALGSDHRIRDILKICLSEGLIKRQGKGKATRHYAEPSRIVSDESCQP